MNKFPEAIHLVRYEELIQNPEHTLAALLDFCELSQDQIVLKYARKVLSPPPRKHPVRLHPAIIPAFEETMSVMGYAGT